MPAPRCRPKRESSSFHPPSQGYRPNPQCGRSFRTPRNECVKARLGCETVPPMNGIGRFGVQRTRKREWGCPRLSFVAVASGTACQFGFAPHETILPETLHLVEQPDLRHAALDLAVRRTGG